MVNWIMQREFTMSTPKLLLCPDPIIQISAFDRVEYYFNERSEAVLPTMYLLKRGLTSLHSAEESSLFFNAPDLSGTSVIIDDKILYLSQIGDVHRRASDEIQREIDELTFHHPTFTLADDISIHDNPRELAPDYSFVKDTRNIWNHQPSLIQHILQTPSLFSRYAYEDPSGIISWKPSEVAVTVKRIYDLQMKILCNIILSYGEPARGTELASHLLENVGGGSIRNFFVLFGIPILRASFNKTASVLGQDKTICRIPLPLIGRHFIRFLVYLRPLFLEWQRYLRPSMAFNAQHYLFAGLHQDLTSDDISHSLSTYTKKELDISLPIRKFRQFMAFITSCNLEAFDAAELRPTATFEQFGHSAEINVKHYGHDSRIPDGMNIAGFMATARVSGVFHILFGHAPELLEQLELGKGKIAHIVSTITKIRRRPEPNIPASAVNSIQALPLPPSGLDLQDIVTALKALILPELVTTVKNTVAESNASVVELFAPKLTAHTVNSPLLPQIPGIVPHPFLLAKLRGLYPELAPLNGGFMNVQQGQVAQVLWERKRHVTYISPTGMFLSALSVFFFSQKFLGSGKTIPGILCAKFLDGRRSTIWLLPLIPLHEQHHYTSKRFGITSESWSFTTSSTVPPKNVLVTIDQATHQTFKIFVASLIKQDLLARFIIDEAHLIITHGSFRPVMDLLQWLASSAVQLVVMTATLPPSLESNLFQAIGVTTSIIIRTTTQRANISYNVVRAVTSLEDTVEFEFRKAMGYSSDNRVLVFCLTKFETEMYASRFNIPFCHSGVGYQNLPSILDRFRNDNGSRALVTTSILGVGLDIPDVTHVIHVNFPRDVISFVQEAGRAGRGASGTPAFSVVVLPPSIPLPLYPSPDDFGAQILHDSLLSSVQCRRLAIQLFLDGTSQPCSMLSGTTHLCDVCKRASESSPILGGDGADQHTWHAGRFSCLCCRRGLIPGLGQNTSHNLIAAAHSRKVYPRPFTYDTTQMQIERAYYLVQFFATSCIACAILGKHSQVHDHLFRDCQNSPSPATLPNDWVEFSINIRYPVGICYHCGIPQKVCQTQLTMLHICLLTKPTVVVCHSYR